MQTASVCSFPEKTKNVLKLANTWSQTLPSGRVVTSQGSGTGGWAIDPNVQNQCQEGGYCPYACETGYIETQYDDSATSQYIWEVEDQGKVKFVGGGRKTVNINGKCIPAGGKQGLYCKSGKLQYNNQVKEYTDTACIQTPRVLSIKNNTKYTITFCRVTNSFGIPQIPSVISPGEQVYLTSIPNCKDDRWAKVNVSESCKNINWIKAGANPIWWNGYNNVEGKSQNCQGAILTYFVSRSDETNLAPVCQANKLRPSTEKDSSKGIDYYPYILTIDKNFKVRLNSNNDALMGSCSGYDPSLGNPKFGMRLFDRDSINIGQVQYVGNSTSCYSYIIDKGKVQYDCKSLRKGLSSSTYTSYSPLTIELFTVADTPSFNIPPDYCKLAICNETPRSRYVKRKAMPSKPRQTTTTTTTNSTSNTSTAVKIIIGVLVVVIIIIIIVVIILLIRYYSKVKKANKEIYSQYQASQLKNIGVVGTGEMYGVIKNPEYDPDIIDLTTLGNEPSYIRL